ncbi:hypothetical protein OIU77_010818 [Salix suchowensis]|uniref:Uncharacterized protein n=1 Tax=Salix suchowensis TaxID=1278906 RepID=A0ABQ9A9T9_9ROSI|nr:hypothetical protein OIU77_010818 [Salix suchowensis]
MVVQSAILYQITHDYPLVTLKRTSSRTVSSQSNKIDMPDTRDYLNFMSKSRITCSRAILESLKSNKRTIWQFTFVHIPIASSPNNVISRKISSCLPNLIKCVFNQRSTLTNGLQPRTQLCLENSPKFVCPLFSLMKDPKQTNQHQQPNTTP